MGKRSLRAFCIIAVLLFAFAASDFSEIVFAKGFDGGTMSPGDARIKSNKKKWGLLRRDMPVAELKEVLGEPERIIEGVVTTWYYNKGGSVNLVKDKVLKWTKPFNWDY